MSQHTPGPWSLEHEEPYCADIVDQNGRKVFGLSVWLDDACYDRNGEAIANGELAAAAPEMLMAHRLNVAALESVMEWLGSIPEGKVIMPIVIEARDRAAAAVACAKASP